MARNVMLSDEVYRRLKRIKLEEDKSFSEVIEESLNKSQTKTIGGLMKHYGALEGDTEYDKVMEEAKRKWREWSERYA